MQSDLLLQEWKKAKETCKKVIEICKMTHLGRGNVEGRILMPGEKQTNKQFINVYDVVYRLCLTKQKEENRVLMVYKDYKDILKTALIQMSPLLYEQKDIYKLDALRKIWDAYSDMQKRINNMFAYLNRPYHLKNDRIEDLQKTSINLIAQTFFNQNGVMQYELLYFKQIDRIRKTDDLSNSKFLAGLVSMFHQIHLKIIKYITNKKARTLYTQLYGRYQKHARQYYSRRFKNLRQLSPGEYFTEVNRIYEQQKQIAASCFVITADTLINKEFSQELVINYKPILLKSELGLKHILKQRQTQILKLIVDLYTKLTKNLDGFKEQFQQYIFEQMKSHIDQVKVELTFKKSLVNYCNFVQKVIKRNQQLINILQEISLVGDFTPYFKSGIQKAFIMSKTPVSMQQLLAIYTQTKFRTQMDQATFQNEVKNIITIFNCIQNKDLFLLKYSQRFTKRILSINESCLKSHQIFISNLNMNCGTKYTEGLQTIITQYRISVENENELKSIIQKNKLSINLALKVFSAGVWPTQTLHQIPVQFLPREIQLADQCINEFKNTFLNKKTIKISSLQSKVRWKYYFDPEIKSKNQICYFETNMLQAALLNYIYKQRPHKVHLNTLHQLMPKISPKLLKQNLNKMTQVAQSLLISEGQGEQMCYSFNNLMKSHKKLISFDQGNSQEEQKLFQNHDLAKDRQIVLDANISKLMKAKKVMDFRSIIQETIKMIKVFVPPAKDVKMSIDRLITKDLLQRDEKDRELIRYKD